MKAALATSHGRMAPCFAGVVLWIVQEDVQTACERDEVLSTHGWHPLAWGRELMRHEVGLLLCSGIDQSTWASVQGHGIQVIPNTMGATGSVLAAWRSGHLSPPKLWPAYLNDLGCNASGFGGGCRRRRFRSGRGL